MRTAWTPIIDLAGSIVGSETARVGQPPTLRRLHYLLVSDATARALGYENTQGAYKRLSSLSAEGRRQGTFPPLLDRTRSINWPLVTEADPATVLRNQASWHRLDRWAEQQSIVVVCEKDGMIPVLEPLTSELGLPISALRGYASQTLVDDIAAGAFEVALHVGDYDPSGLDLERDLSERCGLDVERIALSGAQVVQHQLPPMMAKATDSRLERMRATEGDVMQVEVDALDPLVLRGLLADRITELAYADRWWATIAVEEAERRELLHAADLLDGAS
jgi:hypothetical protein